MCNVRSMLLLVVLMCLAFLALLPAARLGPRVVRKNGSPWPWPWYPWILFGTLALGVLGRAYYLCVSLHFVVGDDSISGPYFWIPFLLVINVLTLEVILSVRRSAVMSCLVVIPIALLAITVTGPSKLPARRPSFCPPMPWASLLPIGSTQYCRSTPS